MKGDCTSNKKMLRREGEKEEEMEEGEERKEGEREVVLMFWSHTSSSYSPSFLLPLTPSFLSLFPFSSTSPLSFHLSASPKPNIAYSLPSSLPPPLSLHLVR